MVNVTDHVTTEPEPSQLSSEVATGLVAVAVAAAAADPRSELQVITCTSNVQKLLPRKQQNETYIISLVLVVIVLIVLILKSIYYLKLYVMSKY